MPRHKLSAKHIKNAMPRDKPYRLFDGDGLCLLVSPTGGKSWQYRYRLAGKGQTASLGRFPDVTLEVARARAADARIRAAQGQNLTVAKRVDRARRIANDKSTFGQWREKWVKYRDSQWVASYKREVTARFRNHLSALDPIPVASLSAAIVAPIVEAIERKAPEVARKCEQQVLAVLDYCVRRGALGANTLPRPERGKKRRVSRKYPAELNRAAVGAILRAAAASDASKGVQRAHLLTAVLAQRIGEIVAARWSEVDFDARVLGIPRKRMKERKSEPGVHTVPIPPQLLAALRRWRDDDREDALWICPAPRGNGHITREAVEKFYRRTLALSGKHSPHSWRSVLSTWANDAGKDGGAVEAQLDHDLGGTVKISYDRGNRLELRHELIAWYEGELYAAQHGARVVTLPAAA